MALEQLAVFGYRRVLASSKLSPAARVTVAGFLAHEREHVRVLRAELLARGGVPPIGPRTPDAADALFSDHGGTGSFSDLHSQEDCLQILQVLESVLEGGYYMAVAFVSEPGLLRTIARIMGVEGQHYTGLTAVRHPGEFEKAVPYAFVQGRH
jgi:hypothetical protein